MARSAAPRSPPPPSVRLAKFRLHSEAEAQPGGGIDVVALEITVRQSAIHLREHDADIGVPLRCKPPIDNGGNRVERFGTLRVSAARAADIWPGREKAVLESDIPQPDTNSRISEGAGIQFIDEMAES